MAFKEKKAAEAKNVGSFSMCYCILPRNDVSCSMNLIKEFSPPSRIALIPSCYKMMSKTRTKSSFMMPRA